ncbi:hypothetical protein C0585_06800 [Candidatus Woesearchaeota archaeon]|nr:MAG: hypothetical protein C0585_06800 [Candidatus Woesearchaeota archaeon]
MKDNNAIHMGFVEAAIESMRNEISQRMMSGEDMPFNPQHIVMTGPIFIVGRGLYSLAENYSTPVDFMLSQTGVEFDEPEEDLLLKLKDGYMGCAGIMPVPNFTADKTSNLYLGPSLESRFLSTGDIDNFKATLYITKRY